MTKDSARDSVKGCSKAIWSMGKTLTLIFTALQATGVIHWAWWQVLALVIVMSAVWLITCIALGIITAARKGEEGGEEQ